MRAPDPCMLCGSPEARPLFEKSGRAIVRCGRCGLEWTHPMPTADELAAYYERSYADGTYSFFAEAQEVRRLIARHRLEAIAAFARDGRWLDVGASSGDFVEIASRERDVEGLELSERAVEEARSRGLRMHCAAVEDFEPEAPYATITAFDVLEHLREPRTFLRRLRGWLRDDGRLVLTLPDVSSFYPRWLMRRHWFFYMPNEHLYYYEPGTVRRLLEEEGFHVETVRSAYKMLTPRYAAANLRNFNAGLGRLAIALVGALPEAIAARPIPMYVGEMMVFAEPR
jgi:cyclopropane fatty-acyl-phospholipid synthase-like methyltransferase